jgi:rhodanese-related sulfurtransferase
MNRVIQIVAVFLLLTMLPLAGCAGGETHDTSDIPRISVDEVKTKLDAGDNIVLVDTRSTEEYREASISGAVSIPLTELLDENDDPLSAEEISQRYSNLQDFDEIITF